MRLKQRMLMMSGGVKYLLRDEFTTDLAAGAVNGTQAEPGGTATLAQKTRTVVDTAGNKLSITGGQVVWAGVTGANDPNIAYGPFTRTLGRMCVFYYPNCAGNRLSGGWNGTPTPGLGWQFEAGFSDNGGTLSIADTIYPTTFVTSVTGVDVHLAIVLRATGSYFFYKLSTDGIWKLGWVGILGNTASLYALATPRTTQHNALEYIHIPINNWLPTALIYDSFTRSNGALGNSETTGIDGTTTPAQVLAVRPWTATLGTWAISTNKAVCSELGVGDIGIATIDAGVRDILISAAITVAAGTAGIVASYVDANNYIYAYHNGTNATLVKVIDGTPTTLINAAAAYGAGRVLRLFIDGVQIMMFYNGAKIGTTQSLSAPELAALTTGTKCGLFTSNTGNSLDTFLVFPSNFGTGDLPSQVFF